MRLEGQQIGRYRLSRLLGSGGMGEVYLAEDPRIEQQVAIKIVQGESVYATESLNKEAFDLFIREVRVIAKLDHPNILPLFDYGEGEIDNMAVTYIVMPYRKEGSLASWLKKQADKPHTSDDIAPFFLSQAARALQHAHEHSIIHQDVKPSNFLLRERNDEPDHPDLLLADFGIARFSSASVNMSMTIRGTPTYMAPEQWRGHPTFASDQYALAIMIYQILTGRAPFLGNIEQLMYAHIHHQAATPSVLNSRISPAVDAVLLKALAKDPDHRFLSLTAFDSAFKDAWQTASQQTATWVLPTISFGGHTPPIPASSTPPSGPQLQGPPRQELYATLAISQEEALNGALRTLTLPGGQQIQVPVQPGAQNGQEFRLERRGDANGGGSTEIIVIKLAIIQTQSNLGHISAPSPMTILENDQTLLSTNEKTHVAVPQRTESTPSSGNFSPSAPTVASGNFSPPPLTPLPDTPAPAHQDIPPPLRRWQTLPMAPLKLSLLIGLIVLILAGSIGGFTYVNQTNLAHSQATATVLGGTAVAATATASWFPYTPNTGRLVLSDPLKDNSKGYHWTAGYTDSKGAACFFNNGAYHVIEPTSNRLYYCTAGTASLSNFTFEVQMAFITGTAKDYGGIFFRSSGKRQYFFRIGRDGSYFMKAYLDNTTGEGTVLTRGKSSAIRTEANQLNTLAVVARGGSFDLYVNQQLVANVNDSTYSQGQVGVVVENESKGTTADVAFTNAKVWELQI